MAENKENKKDNFNFPPIGGGKNIKTPRFNGYWIFLLSALIIIGFNFFGMKTEPVKTNWQEVKTKMLAKGNVENSLLSPIRDK